MREYKVFLCLVFFEENFIEEGGGTVVFLNFLLGILVQLPPRSNDLRSVRRCPRKLVYWFLVDARLAVEINQVIKSLGIIDHEDFADFRFSVIYDCLLSTFLHRLLLSMLNFTTCLSMNRVLFLFVPLSKCTSFFQ